MKLISYRYYFIRVAELYSAMNDRIDLKTDVLIRYNLPSLKSINNPASDWNNKFSFAKEFKTLTIDLTEHQEKIFSNIHRTTKLKIINAVRKDNLRYLQEYPPTDGQIEQFSVFYNNFAKQKNIGSCNKNKLKAYRDNNSLVISKVTDQNMKTLCYHVYIADGKRATLLYSTSNRLSKSAYEKNLISRANRCLHWEDILYFKNMGYIVYDFCGADKDSKDREIVNISLFKESFGGKMMVEYKSYHAMSIVGKIVLLFLLWKWRYAPIIRGEEMNYTNFMERYILIKSSKSNNIYK